MQPDEAGAEGTSRSEEVAAWIGMATARRSFLKF